MTDTTLMDTVRQLSDREDARASSLRPFRDEHVIGPAKLESTRESIENLGFPRDSFGHD